MFVKQFDSSSNLRNTEQNKKETQFFTYQSKQDLKS